MSRSDGSWCILLEDKKLEKFGRKKELIKKGELIYCKPTKSKDKLKTIRPESTTHYEINADMVFQITEDDYQWLLPIPFESTRYEMLMEKEKVWSKRHQIRPGTMLRVYIVKREQVFYASVKKVDVRMDTGKTIEVEFNLDGKDTRQAINISEILEICEEKEQVDNHKKQFRLHDRVVVATKGTSGYIKEFISGETNQDKAHIVYDDQTTEICSIEHLVAEHDYEKGKQTKIDKTVNREVPPAAIPLKQRTYINVGKHKQEIIHHWWNLIRSPITRAAADIFLEKFGYLILDKAMKKNWNVGNDKARAFLTVLLGLAEENYRFVYQYYETTAFAGHLCSYGEESPLNLQSTRENYRMAQQYGMKPFCRELQKTFETRLNVDDAVDLMIQGECFTLLQLEKYAKLANAKERINYLLTHLEENIPSFLALFLQILETENPRLYKKIKEFSDKEAHVWRSVLEVHRMDIIEAIHHKIVIIVYALAKEDILTKEEHDTIKGHVYSREMSNCFIDVLQRKQFPIPYIVFEILKREHLTETAKYLHQAHKTWKEEEKGI